MTRRVLVLANPIAGGGRARRLAPLLATALQGHGLAVEVFFSRGPGELGERARTAGGEPWDALVAVGGDGTVNEVLNGMPDPTRPLGMLPVGTANVLAAEYRLPRRPVALAALLARGQTRAHAIGVANGRRFLLFCGAGVDGAVVERLHAVRTGTLGKRKWVGPILHVVRHWPRFRLRAQFGDGTSLDGLASVLVTRVRNYGGILSLTKGIDPGDGLLHALCFRQRSRTAFALSGTRALLGCLRPSPGLLLRSATSLAIDGSDAPFQVDGDFGGRGPVQVRIDGAANLIAP